jgi:hypothetical protein
MSKKRKEMVSVRLRCESNQGISSGASYVSVDVSKVLDVLDTSDISDTDTFWSSDISDISDTLEIVETSALCDVLVTKGRFFINLNENGRLGTTFQVSDSLQSLSILLKSSNCLCASNFVREMPGSISKFQLVCFF